MDEPDELRSLRVELLDRFDAQPFYAWPATLLRVLIAAFDLAGINPVPPPTEPRLRLIR